MKSDDNDLDTHVKREEGCFSHCGGIVYSFQMIHSGRVLPAELDRTINPTCMLVRCFICTQMYRCIIMHIIFTKNKHNYDTERWKFLYTLDYLTV